MRFKKWRRNLWLNKVLPLFRKFKRYSNRRLTFRELFIVAMASYCAIAVVFYLLVFSYQDHREGQLKSQLTQSGHLIHKMTLDNVSRTGSKVLHRPLPNVKALDYFQTSQKEGVQLLLGQAEAHAMFVSESKIGTVTNVSNKFVKATLTLTATGKYQDIGEFLFAIYDLPILTNLVSIALVPEEGTYLNKMQAKIDIYTYQGEAL